MLGTEFCKYLRYFIWTMVVATAAATAQNTAPYEVLTLNTTIKYYGVVYVAPNMVQTWLYIADERLLCDEEEEDVDTDLLAEGQAQLWEMFQPWAISNNDGRNALELAGTDYDSTDEAVLCDLEGAVQSCQLRVYKVDSIRGFGVSDMDDEEDNCGCNHLAKRDDDPRWMRNSAVIAFTDPGATDIAVIQNNTICNTCYNLGEVGAAATKAIALVNRGGYELDFTLYYHHNCRYRSIQGHSPKAGKNIAVAAHKVAYEYPDPKNFNVYSYWLQCSKGNKKPGKSVKSLSGLAQDTLSFYRTVIRLGGFFEFISAYTITGRQDLGSYFYKGRLPKPPRRGGNNGGLDGEL